MFGHEQIIVIHPLSHGQKIITQFDDLSSLGLKPACCLVVGGPVNGSKTLGSPLVVDCQIVHVRGDCEGIINGLFDLG